jgi:capsular exopolysaccharide synthesis family protein
MALGGASVLLIDADLRRGTIHEYFKIRKEPGLTDALSGSLKIEDFPRPLAAYPGLAVLPTGVTAPNPSEVLSSHRMVEFLEQCRKKFDFVIIDSAPLLLVSDSHALAARADAVLLVVRAGVTRKRAIARVKEVLRREKSPLIGAVLNDVNLKIENYYTYGGSYGYHKYESK